MIALSNQTFIETVFGDTRGVVFLCSFPGDPAKGNYNPVPLRDVDPENNNYFCVSTMTTDRRLVENFFSIHCLVIDDVVAKVDPDLVRRVLPAPTWVFETSPGNEQWGYLLSTPNISPAFANGLVEAACRTFGIGDMAGINRLVRLPSGRNWKPQHNGFETVVHVWEPEHRFSYAVLSTALSATPVEIEEHGKPFLPAHMDPIVLALEKEGLRCEPKRDPGKYDIECPWLDTHTDQRDDGAAYIAPSGFKCHHGHCQDKTFADLRTFLEVPASEIDRVEREANAIAMLGAELEEAGNIGVGPEVPDSNSEGSASDTVSDETDAPTSASSLGIATFDAILDDTTAEVMAYDRYNLMHPQRWVFRDLVTPDTAWVLYGRGGLGKGMMSLGIALSAATGLPLGSLFIPENEDGVRVLLLPKEDSHDALMRRVIKIVEHYRKKDARWGEAETAAKIVQNLLVIPPNPEDTMSPSFVRKMKRLRKQRGAFGLVIADPVMSWHDPELDQDIYSPLTANRLINTLSLVAKALCDNEWSALAVHHENKSGGQFGSIFYENSARLVLHLSRTESQIGISITKANESVKSGAFVLDAHPRYNALWPLERVPFLDVTVLRRYIGECMDTGEMITEGELVKKAASTFFQEMDTTKGMLEAKLKKEVSKWRKRFERNREEFEADNMVTYDNTGDARRMKKLEVDFG